MDILESELLRIIVISVFTSGLTYWLTGKREQSKLSIENKRKALQNVYIPVIKEIDRDICPGVGYDGLSVEKMDSIIKIFEDNESLIEAKMMVEVWRNKELRYHNDLEESNIEVYDLSRKFFNEINRQYQMLRKDLKLPYNKNRFGIKKYISRYKTWQSDRIRKKYFSG